MAFSFNSRLNVAIAARDETRRPLEQARRGLMGYGRETDATALRLRHFTRDLNQVAWSMRSVSQALNATALANSMAFQLDKSTRNLAIQMGESSDNAEKMQHNVLALANSTGASVEQVTRLEHAMLATGQRLQETDTGLVNLVRHFRLSGEEVAKLNIQARSLGSSIDDLTESTLQFQTDFHLPGMMSELPRVVDFAHKAMTRFSRATLGDQKRLVESTLRTGAVLSRALGRPLAEGVNMAQESIDYLARSADQTRDVFLGVEGDFSNLDKILMQMSGPRVRQVFATRGQGPLAFAERLRFEIQRMEQVFGRNSARVEYYRRQLQRELPEALRTLVFSDRDFARAQEESRRAQEERGNSIGRSAGLFDQMTSRLNEVGSTAIETFKNLLTLGKTAFGLLFASDVGDIFTTVNTKLKEFNTYIYELAGRLDRSEGFAKFRAGLRQIGPIAVGVAAAFGAIGSGISALAGVSLIWRPIYSGARLARSGLGLVLDAILYLPRAVGHAAAAILTTTGRLSGRFISRLAGPLIGGGRFIGGLLMRGLTYPFRQGTWASTIISAIARPFAAGGSLIVRAFGGLGRLFMRGVGGGLTRFIGAFAKFSIGGLIKSVFSAVFAFKSIGVALDEFGKAIRDPRKTGIEKFKAFFRAAFKGIADFADTILLGIPTMISNALGAGTFTEVFMGWGEDIANFFTGSGSSRIGQALTQFKTWLSEQLEAATGYLFSPEFEESVTEAGENIGAALGWGLRQITDVGNWRRLWDGVVAFFTGRESQDRLTVAVRDALTGAFNAGARLITGILDGMLGQLGTSIDEMKGVFTDLWTYYSDEAKAAFDAVVRAVRPMIMALMRPLASFNDNIKASLAQMDAEVRAEEERAAAQAELLQQARDREAAIARVRDAIGDVQNRIAAAQQGDRGHVGADITALTQKVNELQAIQNLLSGTGSTGQIRAYIQMAEEASATNISAEEAVRRLRERAGALTAQLTAAQAGQNEAQAREAQAGLDRLRLLGNLLEAATRSSDARDLAAVRSRIAREVASTNVRTTPVAQGAPSPTQTAAAASGPQWTEAQAIEHYRRVVMPLIEQQQRAMLQVQQQAQVNVNVRATPDLSTTVEQRNSAGAQRALGGR